MINEEKFRMEGRSGWKRGRTERTLGLSVRLRNGLLHRNGTTIKRKRGM
jgi:hypothetical protein